MSRACIYTCFDRYRFFGINDFCTKFLPKEGFVLESRKCLLTKSRVSSGTVSDVPKNSLGNAVPIQKSSFAGEVPVASCTVLRQPRSTIGSAATQLPFMLRQRREVFRERWNLSIIPFACG